MRRNTFKTRRKFERLEDRRMMAGDLDLISEEDDVLYILGTSGNDEIVIAADPEDSEDVLITVRDRDTGEILDEGDRTGFTRIEVRAGDGNDIVTNETDIRASLFGEIGNDTLESGDGNDHLEGGVGNDILIGGLGNDTYVYQGRNVGSDEIQEAANVDTDTLDFSGFDTFVSVDLERVFSTNNPDFVATGFMTNLQLKQSNSTGLEDVKGSALTDTIRGNSRPNHFWGGDEDDKLAGRGGNDILEGQSGDDTYEFAGSNLGTDDIIEAENSGDDRLRFSGMESGVTVDLSKAGTLFAVDSADLRLRLNNDTAIESVFGSCFDDTIIGNSRNNTLRGSDGKDVIRGGGGADELRGDAGVDSLQTDALDQAFGGAGRDVFDGFREVFDLLGSTNPRPGRYIDWGTL
jgi:Ca2+-binding RTX toxin-like protein